MPAACGAHALRARTGGRRPATNCPPSNRPGPSQASDGRPHGGARAAAPASRAPPAAPATVDPRRAPPRARAGRGLRQAVVVLSEQEARRAQQYARQADKAADRYYRDQAKAVNTYVRQADKAADRYQRDLERQQAQAVKVCKWRD